MDPMDSGSVPPRPPDPFPPFIGQNILGKINTPSDLNEENNIVGAERTEEGGHGILQRGGS